MKTNQIHKLLTILIATVWLANGFLCKIMNLVPRHQEIVGRILRNENPGLLTILIGTAEIVMGIWILSKYKPRINAIVQIVVIGSMNLLEFVYAPDLLLWHRLNIVFAFLFMGVIYYNEFKLKKKNEFS